MNLYEIDNAISDLLANSVDAETTVTIPTEIFASILDLANIENTSK